MATAAALSLSILPSAQGEDAVEDSLVQLVRVVTPTWEAKDRLTGLGLDLTEHGGADFVEVVLHDAADAEVLRDAGFTWTVEIDDMAAQLQENAAADRAFAAATVTSSLPSGRDSYRTLADYESELRGLAAAQPDLVRLLELPHRTLEGKTVLGIEITTNAPKVEDGKPVFLLMGVHHAREWPSGEHAIEFAHELLDGVAAGDPTITDLIARSRTIVIPVVNPDGFEKSRRDGALFDGREVADDGTAYTGVIYGNPGQAYKRRNCRVIDGQDAPPPACDLPGNRHLGVDLNRNYGASWGGAGASAVPADDTYRGPAPFSEPETQNIKELVSERQVTTLISNHTFSRLVLRPPGVRSAGPPPDEPIYEELGRRMSEQNRYVNQPSYALYDTTGTTEDWSYYSTGGLGFTFEIGDEFHPPYEEVVTEYARNSPAYLIALQSAADPAMHAVIDGRAPAGAVLRLQKTFQTSTSPVRPAETLFTENPQGTEGEVQTFEDHLESVLLPSGRFSWHVNPSTRPAVGMQRIPTVASEPSSTQHFHEGGQPIAPGDHRDVPFTITETDAALLDVSLDWPTPDDYDLELYRKVGEELTKVGSSGAFVNEKEAVVLDQPLPGDYVARVINFASVSPTWTLTAATFLAGPDQIVEGQKETWTLTCESPDGTVLQQLDVLVDRGQRARADLRPCAKALRGRP